MEDGRRLGREGKGKNGLKFVASRTVEVGAGRERTVYSLWTAGREKFGAGRERMV